MQMGNGYARAGLTLEMNLGNLKHVLCSRSSASGQSPQTHDKSDGL